MDLLKEYTIYGLSISEQKDFFYIGITSNSLKQRLSDHLSNVRTNIEPNKVKSGVIIKNKFSIKISPIYTFSATWKSALLKEAEFVNRYLLEGHPLTNKLKKERPTKTLKIPEKVHYELKVYIATSGNDMTDFSGLAIMEKLKNSGHKFVLPIKKKNKSSLK